MGGPGIVNGKSYDELDNFYRCKIEYEGLIYHSSEAMYQAIKFRDLEYRKLISKEGMNAQTAWAMGQSREHQLVENFEKRKAGLMYLANWYKFTQNPRLKEVLVSTAPHKIIFLRSSPYWNTKNAQILEKIRDKLL